MGVSKNNGTPKSSILIGFSIINHPFWGYHHFWKHPYIIGANCIENAEKIIPVICGQYMWVFLECGPKRISVIHVQSISFSFLFRISFNSIIYSIQNNESRGVSRSRTIHCFSRKDLHPTFTFFAGSSLQFSLLEISGNTQGTETQGIQGVANIHSKNTKKNMGTCEGFGFPYFLHIKSG